MDMMNLSKEISECIEKYANGIYLGDVKMLAAAFHPAANLIGEVKGEPYHRTLQDYLQIVALRKSPQELGEENKIRILFAEQQGEIALVKVSCPIFEFNYVDYLSLVRMGSTWVIASKVFTHAEDSSAAHV